MRRLALFGGMVTVVAIAMACSSFSEAEAPAGDGGTTPDPIDGANATPDASTSTPRFCEARADAGVYFCSDFDNAAPNEAGILFPTPSFGASSNDSNGSIAVVDIDGGLGGSAPRAALVDIEASGGATERFIRVDPVDIDHMTCSVDIMVETAQENESFDVVHFFTGPPGGTNGVKIELVPKPGDVYTVELHTDSGGTNTTIGSVPRGQFKRITVTVAESGNVRAQVEGSDFVDNIVALGENAIVEALAFGVHRQRAARVLYDNILCTR